MAMASFAREDKRNLSHSSRHHLLIVFALGFSLIFSHVAEAISPAHGSLRGHDDVQTIDGEMATYPDVPPPFKYKQDVDGRKRNLKYKYMRAQGRTKTKERKKDTQIATSDRSLKEVDEGRRMQRGQNQEVSAKKEEGKREDNKRGEEKQGQDDRAKTKRGENGQGDGNEKGGNFGKKDGSEKKEASDKKGDSSNRENINRKEDTENRDDKGNKQDNFDKREADPKGEEAGKRDDTTIRDENTKHDDSSTSDEKEQMKNDRLKEDRDDGNKGADDQDKDKEDQGKLDVNDKEGEKETEGSQLEDRKEEKQGQTEGAKDVGSQHNGAQETAPEKREEAKIEEGNQGSVVTEAENQDDATVVENLEDTQQGADDEKINQKNVHQVESNQDEENSDTNDQDIENGDEDMINVELCLSDGECVDNKFCSRGGQCVNKKGIGGKCSSRNRCLSGNCLGGLCSDEECLIDEDCSNRQFCKNTTCFDQRRSGEACERNAYCRSGFCLDSLCVVNTENSAAVDIKDGLVGDDEETKKTNPDVQAKGHGEGFVDEEDMKETPHEPEKEQDVTSITMNGDSNISGVGATKMGEDEKETRLSNEEIPAGISSNENRTKNDTETSTSDTYEGKTQEEEFSLQDDIKPEDLQKEETANQTTVGVSNKTGETVTHSSNGPSTSVLLPSFEMDLSFDAEPKLATATYISHLETLSKTFLHDSLKDKFGNDYQRLTLSVSLKEESGRALEGSSFTLRTRCYGIVYFLKSAPKVADLRTHVQEKFSGGQFLEFLQQAPKDTFADVTKIDLNFGHFDATSRARVSSVQDESESESEVMSQTNNRMPLIAGVAAGSAVILILGLFVTLRRNRGGRKSSKVEKKQYTSLSPPPKHQRPETPRTVLDTHDSPGDKVHQKNSAMLEQKGLAVEEKQSDQRKVTFSDAKEHPEQDQVADISGATATITNDVKKDEISEEQMKKPLVTENEIASDSLSNLSLSLVNIFNDAKSSKAPVTEVSGDQGESENKSEEEDILSNTAKHNLSPSIVLNEAKDPDKKEADSENDPILSVPTLDASDGSEDMDIAASSGKKIDCDDSDARPENMVDEAAPQSEEVTNSERSEVANEAPIVQTIMFRSPGALGARIEKTDEGGCVVDFVLPRGQADKAGLKTGDRIYLPNPSASEDSEYDQFLALVKSNFRPLCVQVRRTHAVANSKSGTIDVFETTATGTVDTSSIFAAFNDDKSNLLSEAGNAMTVFDAFKDDTSSLLSPSPTNKMGVYGEMDTGVFEDAETDEGKNLCVLDNSKSSSPTADHQNQLQKSTESYSPQNSPESTKVETISETTLSIFEAFDKHAALLNNTDPQDKRGFELASMLNDFDNDLADITTSVETSVEYGNEHVEKASLVDDENMELGQSVRQRRKPSEQHQMFRNIDEDDVWSVDTRQASNTTRNFW